MNVDLFRVDFPQGADVRAKAVIMASALLFVSFFVFRIIFVLLRFYILGFGIL